MGVFKLGKMTMGSMFKKPETIMYPVATKPQPAGLKGHISIDVENCILCGMCQRSCATDCITVDKAAGTWAIDRFQCIQCGYCTTVCPKKCLHMLPDYAPAATERTTDVINVSGDGKPAAKKEEPQPKQTEPSVQDAPKHPDDAVLLAKVALLDDEKAEKVRAALGL